MRKRHIVFVVDDDASARRGISRLLRTAGHDVYDFRTADEFLAAVDPDATGCIVLDARMPGLSPGGLHAELQARLSAVIVSLGWRALRAELAPTDLPRAEAAASAGAVEPTAAPVE